MIDFELGKVTFFDGYCGRIVSEKGEYLFLDGDIKTDIPIEVGNLVAFRGEIIHGSKRAYFVRSVEEVLRESEKQKRIENSR